MDYLKSELCISSPELQVTTTYRSPSLLVLLPDAQARPCQVDLTAIIHCQPAQAPCRRLGSFVASFYCQADGPQALEDLQLTN
jgi:hypothetical protein